MEIYSKEFSSRSNAVRGARRAGLIDGAFIVEQIEGGKWMVGDIEDASDESIVPEIDEAIIDEAPVQEDAEAHDKRMHHIASFSDDAGRLRTSVNGKGVVKRVHAICESALQQGVMTKTRAQLMQDCANAEIAFYTARTQIQKWARAHDITFPKKGS